MTRRRGVREQVAAGTFPIPHIPEMKHLLWTRADVEIWLKQPAVHA